MKNKPSSGKEQEPGVSGIIVAHKGVAVDVRFPDASIRSVRVKRNSGHVVGDYVEVRGEVLYRLERQTELRRRDMRGKDRLVAANLDVLGIVVSPVPEPPRGFVDRAIVASRAAGMDPFVVVNKCDLPGADAMVGSLKGLYGAEIPVFALSTLSGTGLDELRSFFSCGHRGAFVGTSGVGKSSLLNSLCPQIDLKVGEVSEGSGLGKHTTSVSTLHHLQSGGELVDTPGFRDFGLVDVSSRSMALYFPGFEKALESPCRFRDCRHVNDPGCSVLDALERGEISPDRHGPYTDILEELEAAEDKRGYFRR